MRYGIPLVRQIRLADGEHHTWTAERNLVLTEMRGLLETMQVVVDGLRAGDMKQVAQAARASDLAAAADASPGNLT